MVPMSLADITRVVDGQLFHATGHQLVSGVAVDTRRIRVGDAFAAFEGSSADGHNYISEAFNHGAVVAIVTNRAVVDSHPKQPMIWVRDALLAIQTLAKFERQRFSGPVIGVTGSNGKTTTKDMLSIVFSTMGACLATQGNYNNELGLPLTVLNHADLHRSMVLEMGMRGMGQIAGLCDIAAPTAGVITNIGTSHLELLGSQANIAKAKGELLEAIPNSGYAALWSDDPWLRQSVERCRGRVLWYGVTSGDATATNVRTDQNGVSFEAHILGRTTNVYLPTYGEHNVRNALSALLLGAVYGLNLSDMAIALAELPSSNGRLHIVDGTDERKVIDDCYNASPLSMRASLDVLMDVAGDGPAVAILGDMYELGAHEEQGHAEVGAYVGECDVDCLVAIGPKSASMARAAVASGCRNVYYYPDKQQALAQLPGLLPTAATVLVKASRGMKLEDVVQVLTATSTTGH